jgi:subtilisin-like proprotein convertase family protein
MKAIILTICIFLFNTTVYSQTQVHSVGPAPVVENVKPQVQDFDRQIGTRTFTQHSISSSFQFGKSFMESCTITNIGPPFAFSFSGGLMYRNGIVYTWNQSAPYQLYSVDTVTGAHTLVFNITGVPMANLTGMCWDGFSVYGLATNLSTSQIFTINMTTGVCTPIGTPQAACAGGIMLLGRIGAQYSLFVPDIVADNLYKFNKTTGAATLIGPLGININFGQDGSVDPNDNIMYAAFYTTESQLRKIDTTGGVGPVLCTYTGQVTGLACVRNTEFPWPVTTYCRGGLNIPILDHQTARDSVQVVLGSGYSVRDVNVRIDTVLHTWDADLTFYLRKGTIGVNIINKVGGSGDNFIGTVLNDSAVTPVESGTAPFTGQFIPSNPLTGFFNQPTDGYWKLVITDTAGGDTGVLRRWCLIIIYHYPGSGTTQTVEIPNYYFLNQNYPNPFNPATVIKFGVPLSGDVKLVIYDILGREVSTLVNEHKHPGTYEVNFDASNLSSGVYFYSIQTDNYRETKRMLLVK